MTVYAVAPPPETVLSVEGGGVFPVRRVYCVGRNYADHAREMGGDPTREPPFFFSKPHDAAVNVDAVPYPPATADLHHEVELVIALGAGGADLAPEEASARIFAAGVGVDLTRRDLQAEAKKTGRPWEAAKGFDHSGPVGSLRPGPAPGAGPITLSVNGETRQAGELSDMIWSSAEVIAHLSSLVQLAPGDIIFTGTPSGVGALNPGDVVEAAVADLPPLRFTVTGRR